MTGDPGAGSGGPTAWTRAAAAAALFAVAPARTGGVHVRALPGPVRDAWIALLRELLEADQPYRRVPNHIRDDRLLGGLDLTATLKAGRPICQRGLLAESDGGVIELCMAERVEPNLAARICSVLDSGEAVLERDGIADRSPARLGVVAVDEGLAADERPPGALLDRLAFVVDLTDISWRETAFSLFEAEQVHEARLRYHEVVCPEPVIETLAGTGIALGVWSLRPTQLAVRAARAAAALEGRDVVQQEDASLAAALVLAPRATRVPAPPPEDDEDGDAPEEAPPPEAQEPPAEEEPPPREENETERADPPSPEDVTELGEVVLEAAVAAIPPDLLMRLSQAVAGGRATGAGGKAGALRRSRRRGRPIGVERGDPTSGARISLLDTLRAAAPWQRLRQSLATQAPRSRDDGGDGNGRSAPARRTGRADTGKPFASAAPGARRITVHGEDFRVVRYRERSETTTIFLVDASGSAALDRLAEAKGAVELLLADCYVRRDQVALIAFRGRGAELLLPPTRSLVRAKRELAALPGGGGTPLAAGLDAAGLLIEQIQRQGNTPLLVVLTDGRANVARDGTGGRAQAHADALTSARALRGRAVTSIIVDLSRKAQPKAQEIARALDARYLLLPSADAATLSGAVRAMQ